MRTILIPGFKGGLADSLYDDLSRQTYQSARDLDVYADLEVLAPVYPALTNVAVPSQYTNPSDLSGVNFINYIKTSSGHFFLGNGVVAATNYIILYKAGDLSASPTWTKMYGDTGVANTYGGIDEYKGSVLFGQSHQLKSVVCSSGAASTIGSLTDTNERYGDIMTHKALGRAYFAHGLNGVYTKIGWWDGSTFTEGALNLGAGLEIINLEQAGNFVLAGVRPSQDIRTSYIIVWNGSAATIEDIIEVGDTGLKGFRNYGGVIEAVTTNVPTSTSQFVQRIFRGGMGGNLQLDRELKGINSTISTPNAIRVSGNGLAIGFDSGGMYTLNSKDHKVPQFLSNFRVLSESQLVGNATFKSIRDTGSEIVINWIDTSSGTVHKISTTGGAQASPNTGVFESNIFALNGGQFDKIKRIVINHKAIPSNCGFTVQIKQFANYPWGGSVPSPDSYQDLLTPQGSGSSTGKTQSTNNAFFTEIAGNELFKTSRYAQIKIKYDEVTTTGFPSIVFPIIIETI